MIKLLEVNDYDIPTNGGIYQLYFKSTYRIIMRFKGGDKTGMLYVGETENLKRRLYNLRLGLINANTKIHSIAGYYVEFNFEKYFPLEKLFVKYESCKNHKERENEILVRYIKRFGELPLFNFKRPKII